MKINSKEIIDLLITDPDKNVKIKNDKHKAKLNKLVYVINQVVKVARLADEQRDQSLSADDQDQLAAIAKVIMADHPGTKIQLKPLSHVQRHSFRFVEKALLVLA